MECWICHLNFPSNRDLKNHMMPTHGTMRVVCPWCPDERTYKRVTDLRSHIKSTHPHQLAKYPSDLISENNGVWFSLDPEGYSRLVNGTEWGSTSATHARVLVLEWLSTTRRTTRKKDEWQRGWDKLKITHTQAPTPEALFQPDYDEEALDIHVPTICYTPSAPEIEEMEILHVSLMLGKICLFIGQGRQIFKMNIRDVILTDAKGVASLSRKMSVQKRNEAPQVDQTKMVQLSSPTFQSRLLKFAGLDKNYLDMIYTTIEADDNSPPAKKIRCSSPTPALTAPAIAETPSEPASQSVKESSSSNKPRASMSERALNLLKRGCLPLFPPARRDWGTEQITLKLKDLSILWPPKDWQGMSPDRKLLSWEFTSMTIQQKMDPTRSSSIERVDLLDKFNFLALPGTVEKIGKKEEQIVRKARYYMYEQLKTIVSEDNGDSTWVKMLERSCALRDRSTDDLLAIIDSKNIPIRL